ncbi:MAG: MarR family transcriptional regulator [Armatimonadetes bacterium]|nr:MarR family transcriptional regulator [Armatimonadota bacterium]
MSRENDDGRALHAVVFGLLRRLRGYMRTHSELTLPQFRCLTVARKHPGVSLSELAGRLCLTPATTSGTVDTLVARGLLSRVEAADDRRRIELRLTPAGEEALEAHRHAAEARMAEALAGLDPQERATVATALALLERELERLAASEEPDLW